MKTNFKLDNSQLTDDGKYVFKTGLIFRAGEYEDKNFTMTPEELVSAEAGFSPVPLDIEHIDNLGKLTGNLGTLEAVYTSEDGEALYGTAKIPVWLNDLYVKDDEEIKVSCTWGREDKSLKKLALVDKPRVSDAALFAAFTKDQIDSNPEKTGESVNAFFAWVVENEVDFKDKTWDGDYLIQQVHDITARGGAVCTESKDKAKFVSKKESATIQKMHDMAVSSGAKCRFMGDNVLYKDEPSSEKTNTFGRTIMKFKDIKAWFTDAPDEVIEKLDQEFSGNKDDAEKTALETKVRELTAKLEAKAVETPAEEKKEEFSQVDPEKEELLKKVAELEKRNMVADAEKFADKLVSDEKIVPASKEAVIALFMQAATDDAGSQATEVRFSDEKVAKTRTEVLTALFDSFEAKKLTEEELAGKNVLNFSKETKSTTDVNAAKELAKNYAAKVNKKAGK